MISIDWEDRTWGLYSRFQSSHGIAQTSNKRQPWKCPHIVSLFLASFADKDLDWLNRRKTWNFVTKYSNAVAGRTKSSQNALILSTFALMLITKPMFRLFSDKFMVFQVCSISFYKNFHRRVKVAPRSGNSKLRLSTSVPRVKVFLAKIQLILQAMQTFHHTALQWGEISNKKHVNPIRHDAATLYVWLWFSMWLMVRWCEIWLNN